MKITANRSIKADFDAEAFRSRHKGAYERSAQKKSARQSDIIQKIREAEDPIEEAFELLVPASGKADTVAGEFVRAMMRILYRDYNDGDVFYEGYGIETCADAVAFLCDQIPQLEQDFEDIAWRTMQGNNYTDAIKAISEKVIEYIVGNPETVTQKNDTDMFSFNGKKFIEDREWEPKYDFDCDTPESVYKHLQAGNISERDFQWEVESWDNVRDADRVEVGEDYVSIYGLKRDDYDMVEEYLADWLEDYGQQLNDEYGEPEEEEEEYEDEEED